MSVRWNLYDGSWHTWSMLGPGTSHFTTYIFTWMFLEMSPPSKYEMRAMGEL